jgi:hypothetical protein
MRFKIRAMDPMPSEDAPSLTLPRCAEEGIGAAQGEAGGGGEAGEVAGNPDAAAAEVQDGLAAEAVDVTAVTGAAQAFGRARAGAEPAMHPAAPISHGRLAAATAGAGAGAATGRGPEVAAGIAVAQPAAGQTGGGVELRPGRGNRRGRDRREADFPHSGPMAVVQPELQQGVFPFGDPGGQVGDAAGLPDNA